MLVPALLLLQLLPLPPQALADQRHPILIAAERHARQLAQGQAGEIQVEAGPVDTSQISPCQQLETYTPANTRSIGRTYVGVRCLEQAGWNILVPVRVAVIGHYVTPSRLLAAGQRINADDLQTMSGDIASLPPSAILDPTDAIGKILRNSAAPGQALRENQLFAPLVVKRGQLVRAISSGNGFAVQAEGKALSDAAEGDLLRIRMPNGRIVSGITRADGSITVRN